MSRFTDTVAVVTGAASGIGRATALRLASEGATVVAVDLNPEGLATLKSEVTESEVITVAVNLAEDGAAEKVLAALPKTAGILINNAGIMDGFLPVGEMDDATWDRVFAVNVTATMRLTRALLPGMLEAGKGTIVNLASEAGLRGSCSGAAYTASKHAVIGLTLNTSVIYGQQGIRCNAIAPGPVDTGIDAPFKSNVAAARLGPIMGAIVPAVARPEELAAAICFLASDDASNINGVVLPVDGGWSAI